MDLKYYYLLFFTVVSIIACRPDTPPAAQKEILYVGTFSVRNSEGIYVYRFDRQSRNFELIETITGPDSPSFIDLSPDGRMLYSANRQGIAGDSLLGSVSAYRIDPGSGKLQLRNQSSSYGISPCHIFADTQRLYLSHYAGGSLSVLSLRADGSIAELTDTVQLTGHGVRTDRQEGPHLHSTQRVPNKELFLAADLGTDSIFVYQLENGEVRKAMHPIAMPPGSGPRHFTLSSDNQFLYTANELSSRLSVHRMNWDDHRTELLQTESTLPTKEVVPQNSVADIHLSPDGRFLYVSNRGHDSIAIFSVDTKTGRLRFLAHQSALGETPRNFLIEPQGTFVLVANENSDEIILFDRNQETGLLTPTAIRIAMPSPVSLEWLLI